MPIAYPDIAGEKNGSESLSVTLLNQLRNQEWHTLEEKRVAATQGLILSGTAMNTEEAPSSLTLSDAIPFDLPGFEREQYQQIGASMNLVSIETTDYRRGKDEALGRGSLYGDLSEVHGLVKSNSEGPTFHLVRIAEEVLKSAHQVLGSPKRIVRSVDGGIVMAWSRDGKYADFEVTEDGDIIVRTATRADGFSSRDARLVSINKEIQAVRDFFGI
ncbi:hypothetical protein H0Z60_09925 [Ectothiorhodospiraceae bacterium WFHF3C12]|nr:hypothetical protein [Ectothiorhodospiraceae bacterium WFHF3C12]